MTGRSSSDDPIESSKPTSTRIVVLGVLCLLSAVLYLDRICISQALESIQEDIRRDAAGIFVAVVENDLAGFVSTRMDREAGVGYIPNIAVHRRFRGQGIGRQLLEHAIAHFRQHRLSLARIETLDQNAIGQHLYPSVGFTEIARQIHFAMRLE